LYIQDEKVVILENGPTGNYFKLIFECHGALTRALPGQFINIRISGEREAFPLLRRPFSIARMLSSTNKKSKRIEVLYSVLQIGTKLLSLKRKGDFLYVLGPLGHSFPLPEKNEETIIVSGGIGIAPLIFLFESLDPQIKLSIFLGAKTKREIVHRDVFKRKNLNLQIATEDGTLGTKGYVTAILSRYLEAHRTTRSILYACGPRAMLKALDGICDQWGLRGYFSWEEKMACGIGICLTCACPVKTANEGTNMVRCCTEGPIFETSKIDWDYFV
jgi:dihydroorotate dehydrogenase electron transfer subunit